MSGVIYVPLEQGSGGISSVTGIDPIQDLGNLNKQIKLKDGTAPNQVLEWSGSAWVLIPTPAGLSSVSTDPTSIRGDGTPSDPLEIRPRILQDIEDNSLDIEDLQDNKLSKVFHDASLTGDGSSASPLSVALNVPTAISATANITQSQFNGNQIYRVDIPVTQAVIGDVISGEVFSTPLSNSLNTSGNVARMYSYVPFNGTVRVTWKIDFFVNVPSNSTVSIKIIK